MYRFSATATTTFVASLHYNDVAGAEAQRHHVLRRYQPDEPLLRTLRATRTKARCGVA